MDIPFASHFRNVVLLERDALGLEFPHDAFDFFTDDPGHCCRIVRPGVLRAVYAERAVTALVDDQLFASASTCFRPSVPS